VLDPGTRDCLHHRGSCITMVTPARRYGIRRPPLGTYHQPRARGISAVRRLSTRLGIVGGGDSPALTQDVRNRVVELSAGS
jgi:hypothetical protein